MIVTTACFSIMCAADETPATLTCLNGGGGDWHVQKWYTADGTETNWVDGSIAQMTNNIALYKDVRVAGYIVGSESSALNRSRSMHIGAYGVSLPRTTSKTTVYFRNGGDVHLTASQTWSAGYSGSGVQIGCDVSKTNAANQLMNKFYADEDVTWTIGQNMSVLLRAASDFSSADVEVAAGGKLTISEESIYPTRLNARTLSVNGGQALFYAGDNADEGGYTIASSLDVSNGGSATFYSGSVWDVGTVRALEGSAAVSGTTTFKNALNPIYVAAGATLNFSVDTSSGMSMSEGISLSGSGTFSSSASLATVLSLDGFDGTVSVTSGVLLMPAMSEWPAGITVTTSDTGSILLAGRGGYDATRVGGTGNIVSQSFIITDEVVEDDEITVGSGETLYVMGGGLTANTHLTLNDGATVLFVTNAVVASPAAISGLVHVQTVAASMTGEFSGYLTANEDAEDGYALADSASYYDERRRFILEGPGLIVLSGGCYFENYACLCHERGAASLVQGTFEFGRGEGASGFGGRIMIGDYADLFTVSNGATVLMPKQSNSRGFSIYARSGRTSVMEVGTGGTLDIYQNRNMFIGTGSQNATNVFRIAGGTVKLHHRGGWFYLGYVGGASYSRFEFDSGRFECERFLQSHKNTASRHDVVWTGGTWVHNSDNRDSIVIESPMVQMNIAGPDCVLDLSGAVITNSFNRQSATKDTPVKPWVWTGDGLLTVTNAERFVINSDMENARIALADATLEVRDVNMLYDGTDLVVGTEPLSVDIDSLEIAGDNVGVESLSSLELPSVTVKAGGAWDSTRFTGGPTVGDLSFEDGAVLAVSSGTGTFSLGGDLALPQSMFYNVTEKPSAYSSPMAIFSVAGSLSGRPEWTPMQGSKKFSFAPNGGGLFMFTAGLMMMFF